MTVQSPTREIRAIAHLPLAALALAIVLLALACSRNEGGSDETAASGPKRREPTRVRTAAVEQREMVKVLSTTTVIESEHEVKVFPRATGVVTELRAEEGDRVTAGTVLAVLDRRQTKAMIEDARVAVREAEDNVRKADLMKSEAESRITTAQIKHDQSVRDYERNEKANLISAQALDALRVARDTALNELETARLAAQRSDVEAKASRTTLEKSKLALERQELDDSYMEITAPFDGVVAQRLIKAGDSVGPAAPAFVVTDTKNLRAVFYRPQRELPLFLPAATARDEDGRGTRTGALEIRALPEALPGVVFGAELQLVSPSIDPQSGSFRVTVRMGDPTEPAPRARLLPGMLVRLEVVTERHPDALVVPKRALRREGEQNLVFTVADRKAHKVEVLEGFSDDTSVEIAGREPGAITTGMRVIVVGNRELEDGADVQEENAPAGEGRAPVPGETTTVPAADAPKKG